MSELVLTIGANSATRPITDFAMAAQAAGYLGPPAASYYVDGNVLATGNGSPTHPFLTLGEAITASNTSIGLSGNRWFARRNQIFVCGDQEIEEDLNIWPEKCDVIGVGFDIEAMPRIIGNHTVPTPVGTTKAYGTRWFNVGFMEDDGVELFHLDTNMMGIEFHGCIFWPKITGSTYCFRLDDNNRAFKMIGCRMLSNAGGEALFAEGITVAGTGQHDHVIKNNYIYAAQGIELEAGTQGYNGVIDNNIIRATAITIKDTADLCIITNNILISAANSTSEGVGVITGNDTLSAGNRISCGDDVNSPWPQEGTLDG